MQNINNINLSLISQSHNPPPFPCLSNSFHVRVWLIIISNYCNTRSTVTPSITVSGNCCFSENGAHAWKIFCEESSHNECIQSYFITMHYTSVQSYITSCNHTRQSCIITMHYTSVQSYITRRMHTIMYHTTMHSTTIQSYITQRMHTIMHHNNALYNCTIIHHIM